MTNVFLCLRFGRALRDLCDFNNKINDVLPACKAPPEIPDIDLGFVHVLYTAKESGEMQSVA